MTKTVYVVSLYGRGERRPSDCYPDFACSVDEAEYFGREAIRLYGWVERFTIRRIALVREG